MKRDKIFTILVMTFLLIAGVSMINPVKSMAATREDKVVKYARDNYYGINRKIKKKTYKSSQSKNKYKIYRDTNKKVRKILIYPKNTSMSVSKCTTELYFDKNEKLVFVFAYKKVGGKVKEYRFYYGTEGKLYRYINSKGKISHYKNGKKIAGTSGMAADFYRTGMKSLETYGKKKTLVTSKMICVSSMKSNVINYYSVKFNGEIPYTYGKLKTMKASSTIKYYCYTDDTYSPMVYPSRCSRSVFLRNLKTYKKYNKKGFYLMAYIQNKKCIKLEEPYLP